MNEVALRHYLANIEKELQTGKATEHTYRPALKELLEVLDSEVHATNEPKREACGAPDYIVTRDRPFGAVTIGYVEAKDVGVGLDKVEKSEQLARYKPNLANLILTDYIEFRWFVNGERRMVARLATVVGHTITWDAAGANQVSQLLTEFLEHNPEPIRQPRDLAQRMARLTHLVRDLTLNTFTADQSPDDIIRNGLRPVVQTLRDLHNAFRETLIPQLTEAEFSDMFAQTLAYGLFAARYNHTGPRPFQRTDAARDIPKTNPFLRRLFETVTGSELDDAPFIGFVDDIAQLLAETDMEAVLAQFGRRTRQTDPIVHFYETFLAEYDPKLREARGVYYTPEPVVSYIVRSVDHLLRTDFGCVDGLASNTMSGSSTDRVVILDPACGTGTFLYSVIDLIREGQMNHNNAGMWSQFVRDRLLPRIFGFELLMAPYAMAHLKLGMQLAGVDLPATIRAQWAYQSQGEDRLNVYLTNTLEEAAKRTEVLMSRYISDEANEAASIKKDYPVMVVLGNPPYSGHSANKGQWINMLLHGRELLTGGGERKTGSYFEVDGQPLGERNPKWINDDYVKFIRFAQWRIEHTGHGILAFITNHGYLDNPTFRGMRQSLMQTFDAIYILDLHGNSKKKERSPDGSVDQNVFDIQQGVAIAIFVRHHASESRPRTVRHAHLYGARETYGPDAQGQRVLTSGKYHWLAEHSIVNTAWTEVVPQSPYYLFTPQNMDLAGEYAEYSKVSTIFPVSSVGIVTARDSLSVHFTAEEMWRTLTDFISLPTDTARYKYKLGEDTRDWQVDLAQKDVVNSGPVRTKVVPIVYRPFDTRQTYYTGNSRGFQCMPRAEVMQHMLAGKNLGISTTRSIEIERGWEHVFCSRNITQHHTVSLKEVNYLFPLYLYPVAPKTNGNGFPQMEPHASTAPGGRHANLAPEFIAAMADKLGMTWVDDGTGDRTSTFGPEDVFSYMYAIFHAPEYRERYAEYLKTDFPRLPLTTDAELFRALGAIGDELVGLHLLERRGSPVANYPIQGSNVVEAVRYTEPGQGDDSGRVWINATQYFRGITPDIWDFHVGGYQVCQKWLKDRKGRSLNYDDMEQYLFIVAALARTITLMATVDDAIEEHGGWPIR